MSAATGRGVAIRTLQLGMSWLPEQAGNGLDRVYHALAHHLPEAGVEVDGLVAGSENVVRTSDQRVRAFAPEKAALLRRLSAARGAVREALVQRTPDVVASHFALHAFPALDLLRGLPLVVHFQGPWAQESQVEGGGVLAVRAKAAIERAVYRRGRLFIVLSRAFAGVLRDQYGVDERRIRVVPAGVDVDRFHGNATKEEARERLGWPKGRPILLSVRRLYHRMGLENLIEGFRIVHRGAPDAVLYVAGKGPLAARLQARIDGAGLGGNVRLLGFVSEELLPLAYRAADLSVVPTVALEGFGLITLESLASGTPVVVTPVGGLPEVVGDLASDLILPDPSPAAIAERLAAILGGTLRLPDAETCRRYARDRFGWDVVAQRTRQVYEEALHG